MQMLCGWPPPQPGPCREVQPMDLQHPAQTSELRCKRPCDAWAMQRTGRFILGMSIAIAGSAVVPIIAVLVRRGSGGGELIVISFVAIVPSLFAATIGSFTRPAHVVHAGAAAGSVAFVFASTAIAMLGGGYEPAFGPMSSFAILGWTAGAIAGAVTACRMRATGVLVAAGLAAVILALVGPAISLIDRRPDSLRVELRDSRAALAFAGGVVPSGHMLPGMNLVSACGDACYMVGVYSDAPASDVEATTAYISSFPGVVDVTAVESSG